MHVQAGAGSGTLAFFESGTFNALGSMWFALLDNSISQVCFFGWGQSACAVLRDERRFEMAKPSFQIAATSVYMVTCF